MINFIRKCFCRHNWEILKEQFILPSEEMRMTFQVMHSSEAKTAYSLMPKTILLVGCSKCPAIKEFVNYGVPTSREE